MEHLVNDLSTLTNVTKQWYNKVLGVAEQVLCDYVDTMMNDKKNDVVQVDIGLGIISILVQNNELKYSFTPSESLNKSIIEMLETGENPLIKATETNLEGKILKAYKELL